MMFSIGPAGVLLRVAGSRLACIAVLSLAVVGGAAAQGGPPQVTVATPLASRVAQWDEFTGRFEATQRVEVRPRVSGYIDQVHFRDGGTVKQGDLLFTIDQRPFQIAVDAAEADVVRTKAQVMLDIADYDRAQQLVKTAATPVRELDQRKANLDIARAQEMSAEAALRTAQLNLEWSEVRAPISGRVSDRRVDPGNLVAGGQNGATLLTTIVSLDPIYFVFDGSEADYIRYSRLSVEGQRGSSRDTPNPVKVRLADETDWRHNGVMNFVDNEINAHSGTIRGRAIFENKDFFLTPGTFGRLRLYGGPLDALLIPDAAVVSDQAHKVVLTVGEDNKVVARPVTLGGMARGLRVVASGLTPTDRVVIAGLANPFVRPGVTVATQQGEVHPSGSQFATE
ncbi:MAG TPA: efflux RND transporter periplasmic adaptor subunit [Acetobacteraceae bacterium]|nr:efflux RND transporter periplasmic adaptor subunit [Acetobacteraceae bacterium]